MSPFPQIACVLLIGVMTNLVWLLWALIRLVDTARVYLAGAMLKFPTNKQS
jgi:hypothetical protein